MFLAQIADRVLNRPLLITPDKAQVILSVLAGRIGVDGPDASRFEGEPFARDADGRAVAVKPYRVAGGVAIISITGSLVNRGAWIGASSGLTSYEGVQHQLKTALADPDVHSVIVDLSTPGGEAIGAMETAAHVRTLAKAKRTVALVNGMACSAGYAIASGASEIVTTETGVSGSIGVVLLHADFSRNLDEEGITPTLIFAGAHKVDGNPFEPLSDSVRQDLQAEVNAFYDSFTSTVGKGRGQRLTASEARATEARTFIGAKAVAAGLADRVGLFEDVLSELSKRTPGGRSQNSPRRSPSMSENSGAPVAETPGISQAELERAKADAKAEGRSEALATVASVLSAEGIAGQPSRMTAALECLAEGMSAEKATAFATKHVAEATAARAMPEASLDRRSEKPDSLAAAAMNAANGASEPQKSKLLTLAEQRYGASAN
ncbi:putative phage head-tail preconnector protein [Aurantimonas sp. 22II-16-19i]|nr:putative phage head-tail preconnector protein [Aurantimonas sp. 22II-16-19i]